MSDINTKFAERNALVGIINPTSQAAGAQSTGWVAAANFHQLVALISIGVFGASATVDAKFQQATDGTGTGAKDVTGKAITQLLAAGGNNRQAVLEMRDTDVDTNGGFTHVRFTLTVGTAATLTSAVLLGALARNKPASALNAASVAQLAG